MSNPDYFPFAPPPPPSPAPPPAFDAGTSGPDLPFGGNSGSPPAPPFTQDSGTEPAPGTEPQQQGQGQSPNMLLNTLEGSAYRITATGRMVPAGRPKRKVMELAQQLGSYEAALTKIREDRQRAREQARQARQARQAAEAPQTEVETETEAAEKAASAAEILRGILRRLRQ